MLWTSILPWHLHARRRTLGGMPFVPIVAIAYFVYFGLPIFTGSIHHYGGAQEASSVTQAAGLALIGQLLMVTAAYVPWGAGVVVRPCVDMNLILARKWLVGAAVCFLPLSVVTSHMRGLLPTVAFAPIYLLSRLTLLCLAAFYLAHLRHGSGRIERCVALATAVGFAVVGLATGSVAPLIQAAMPFGFVYLRERRRIPWVAVALGSMVVMPLLTTKHEYRARAWHRDDVGLTQKIELFASVTIDAISSDGAPFLTRASRMTQSRTSLLGTFAYVVETTPSRVPYWEGETYRNVGWTLIPRFMMPDKPAKTLGQDFGHRYMLMDASNRETSYNLPQIVEMYANFGTSGVIAGMFLVGLFYRLFQGALSHGREGSILTAVAAVLFSEQLAIESDAGLILASAPQTVIMGVLALSALGWLGGGGIKASLRAA
jgi:hypothetical protein